MSQAKDEARKFLDEIPDNATWDDIMYEFNVWKKVELGLADLDAGRVFSQEEIEKQWLR